jgi:ribosomal protein S18 acetylase RimI-like enzyme
VPIRARFMVSDRVILGAVMGAIREASASAELSIRSGTDDDISDVLRLWREAETARSATDDPNGLFVLLKADSGALLVARSEGLIVGALIATFHGWRGNMYRLAVLPTHRRRGVARSLVLEGERRLRSVGARRNTALVGHELEGAETFWSAAGYGPDARTTRFVKTLL